MKKTMKTLLALMAGVVAFSACSKENSLTNDNLTNTPEVKGIHSFTAFTESDPATRATIDGLSVKWQSGDAIVVMGDSREKYCLSTGEGTTSGTFTAVGSGVSGSDIYAIYPYTAYDGDFDNVVIPSTQTVSAGQVVDPKAVLMVAKADEVNNLAFKNVCSYIKVTPTAELKKIVVSANNDENLAAKFRVHISESAPAISSKTDVSSSVTLQAAEGNLAAGTYYIAVLPGTLAVGLNIKFYTNETKYTESGITTSFTFERNKVYNGGSQPEASTPTTGTAKATIGGREVDVNWVQLWENGPKFAEYNVGVTDGKAESYGGYYAWGGSQDMVDDHNTGTDALEGTHDTATKLWGSAWRMPTQAELRNLISECVVSWTTVNDVNGRKFTGKGKYSSNSVFLPAAGYRQRPCNGSKVESQGANGSYWSSTPTDSNNAYNLDFTQNFKEMLGHDRDFGVSVRAVLK